MVSALEIRALLPGSPSKDAAALNGPPPYSASPSSPLIEWKLLTARMSLASKRGTPPPGKAPLPQPLAPADPALPWPAKDFNSGGGLGRGGGDKAGLWPLPRGPSDERPSAEGLRPSALHAARPGGRAASAPPRAAGGRRPAPSPQAAAPCSSQRLVPTGEECKCRTCVSSSRTCTVRSSSCWAKPALRFCCSPMAASMSSILRRSRRTSRSNWEDPSASSFDAWRVTKLSPGSPMCRGLSSNNTWAGGCDAAGGLRVRR